MLIEVKRLPNNFIQISGDGLTQQDLFEMACELSQAVWVHEDNLICENMEDTEEIIYNVITINHDVEDIHNRFTKQNKWTETNYILYE